VAEALQARAVAGGEAREELLGRAGRSIGVRKGIKSTQYLFSVYNGHDSNGAWWGAITWSRRRAIISVSYAVVPGRAAWRAARAPRAAPPRPPPRAPRAPRRRARPRVRSHCRFRNRGTEYARAPGMKRMSGAATRQCDRALAAPPPPCTAWPPPAPQPRPRPPAWPSHGR
jgi:hypothetical protein